MKVSKEISNPYQKLFDSLQIEANDSKLYQQALTHKSFSRDHNERLEFLGDALIGFVIGEALFQKLPDKPEGELSRFRSQLVKRETLAAMALQLELPEYIALGAGEASSGGASRPSILADCFEALCGAMYLDLGFNDSKMRILQLFDERIQNVETDAAQKDPKTALQELLQSRKLGLPLYRVVQSEGDDHQKCFTVECSIESLGVVCEAQGSSKKLAEKKAAKLALNAVKEKS